MFNIRLAIALAFILVFSFTHPSTEQKGSLLVCFLCDFGDRQELHVIGMKKKTRVSIRR